MNHIDRIANEPAKPAPSPIKNRIIFMEKRMIPRDDGKKYMMRFTIFECKWISFKIHKFYASDDQCLHDHPWAFISFILWRGYTETTPEYQPCYERDLLNEARGGSVYYKHQSKRIYPGMIIYRPAKWIHRVEIDKPAWTFVVSFKRFRKWGFYTKNGWIHFKLYSQKEHC